MRRLLWIAIAATACGGAPKTEPVVETPTPPLVVPKDTPIATQSRTSPVPLARKDATVDTYFG